MGIDALQVERRSAIQYHGSLTIGDDGDGGYRGGDYGNDHDDDDGECDDCGGGGGVDEVGSRDDVDDDSSNSLSQNIAGSRRVLTLL